MNQYPVWWDTTLTIYNKYEDAQTNVVTWFRKTIDNCFWKYSNNKVTINDTVLDSNNVICRIPENELFKEKYEWLQLPNDEMGNYFTLGQGDIIVKGDVNFEIDEYTKGQRSTDLLARYKALQGCMQIEQFSVNVGAGRCDPHYYIAGI